MAKVIGIIGSRSRNSPIDLAFTYDAFQQVYEEGDTIVSGGCPSGGDRFAEDIARLKHITILIHPAQWKKYGRSAGFNRNTYIAQDADILIACVAADRKGGTEDTIRKFLAKGPDQLARLILV